MLIGFIGKMGSGKTTAADYLVETYGFHKHNFKDALDKELLRLYPTVLSELAQHNGIVGGPDAVLKHKPTVDSLRELKQRHGTDVRRAQNENYWVSKWITYYRGYVPEANVCVDDVRFLNEVDAVKRMGGLIVRIERSDITDTGDHPSETELDDFEADITITADKGDLMMVQMSLDNIVDNDLGREEDSDDSGAASEYAEEESKE